MDQYQQYDSFSSTSGVLYFDGEPYIHLQNFNYSDKLEGTKGWGFTRSNAPLRQTAGQYDVDDVTFDMEWNEWWRLRGKLLAKDLGGYGKPYFDITVNLIEPPNVPITEHIKGCRIKTVGRQFAVGADEFFVSITCSAMRIIGEDEGSLYDNSIV
jgi:hypothetical protein